MQSLWPTRNGELEIEHLTPTLSPFEAERENYFVDADPG